MTDGIPEHECVYQEYGKTIKCFHSTLSGKFMLTLHDRETDVDKTNIDNFFCHVNFCPFCGHVSKK